jgi:TRAP-type C4-dicarboxylate transport system substrate-binding protein
MEKERRVVIGVCVCVVLVLTVLCFTGEKAYGADKVVALSKSYDWKMASALPPSMFENRALVEFINKLKERTNGKVNVTLFQGTLGAQGDHWDMVKGNAVQFALMAEAYAPGRMPVASLTNLPFEVPDTITMKRVVDGWMKAGYLKELTDEFKIIFYKPTLLHQLFLSKKKITKLEDFKGVKIRAAASLSGKAISAMGAAAVSMSGGEQYLALQTGVIDGVITGVEGVVDRKLYEVCKIGLEQPVLGGMWAVIMNKETWNSLPKELQALIDEIAKDVAESDFKALLQIDKDKTEVAKQKGVVYYSVSPDEIARWRKAASEVDDAYVKEWSAKGYPVKAALEMMRKIAAEKK